MKKLIKAGLWLFLLTINKLSFAATDWWIFWWEDEGKKLREWNIHIDDIPVMIKNATDFLMWIAGTIAIIFVIIWAYKILFGSLEQDKTKWRDTIIMALWGFALASLAWFIVKLILDNFA